MVLSFGAPNLSTFARLHLENRFNFKLTLFLAWYRPSWPRSVVLLFRSISSNDIQKCRILLSRCWDIDPNQRRVYLILIIICFIWGWARVDFVLIKVLWGIKRRCFPLLLLHSNGLLLTKTVSLSETRGAGKAAWSLADLFLLRCDFNRIVAEAAATLTKTALRRHLFRSHYPLCLSHSLWLYLLWCGRLIDTLWWSSLLKTIWLKTWLLFYRYRWRLWWWYIISRFSELIVVEKALTTSQVVTRLHGLLFQISLWNSVYIINLPFFLGLVDNIEWLIEINLIYNLCGKSIISLRLMISLWVLLVFRERRRRPALTILLNNYRLLKWYCCLHLLVLLFLQNLFHFIIIINH